MPIGRFFSKKFNAALICSALILSASITPAMATDEAVTEPVTITPTIDTPADAPETENVDGHGNAETTAAEPENNGNTQAGSLEPGTNNTAPNPESESESEPEKQQTQPAAEDTIEPPVASENAADSEYVGSPNETPHAENAPTPPQHTSRIVGGHEIPIESAPWQVALIDGSKTSDFKGQFCGGSIIDNRWILTAAHCLEDIADRDIRVLAGTETLSDAALSTRSIVKSIAHSKYNPHTFQNDIALLQLSAPLKFSTTIQPIVPTRTVPGANQAAQISGWGFTCAVEEWPNVVGPCPNGGWSEHLNSAKIQIHSQNTCAAQIPSEYDPQTMLCASAANHTIDACFGDSGGPLTTRSGNTHTLTGITSWGYGCAYKYPGVYTNVANYHEWIEQHVFGSLPQPQRLAGLNRFATAVKISQDTYPKPGSAHTVILATGHNFPDALSAAPLAAKLGGPLLLTANPALSPETAAELTRLAPQKVVIVGSTAAVSSQVEQAVKKLGISTERVYGADRFETSLAIAKHGWGESGATAAFIATGLNYPDALSAGAAAAREQIPVILTNGSGTKMTPKQIATLQQLQVQRAYIAGSAKAVSPGIHAQLSNLLNKNKVQRFDGTDRVHTSILIASEFGTVGNPVYVTNAWKFPDALTGAPAAGAAGGVLLLSPPTCLTDGLKQKIVQLAPNTVKLLGDRSSLSAEIERYRTCTNT